MCTLGLREHRQRAEQIANKAKGCDPEQANEITKANRDKSDWW